MAASRIVDDQSDPEALDQRVVKAIDENDVETIEGILRSNEMTVNHRITTIGLLILSEAIENLKVDIVSRILKIASEIGQTVEFGEPLCTAFVMHSAQDDKTETKRILEMLMIEFDHLELSQRIKAAFVDRDCVNDQNAFMRACYLGYDDFVMKFLDLIQDGMEPECSIDWFWDQDKDYNVFHYFAWFESSETRLAMIERIPFTKDLVNAGCNNFSPLYSTIFDDRKMATCVDAAKLLITYGSADMDVTMGTGQTILFSLITSHYVDYVKMLLRCGCKMDIYDNDGRSPLSIACRMYTAGSTDLTKRKVAQIIEYILAFGVSLDKELYLYELDELPDEYHGDQYEKRRSAGSSIGPVLLEKLKELRRSSIILSLKHICRKAIRQHLRPKADEIIPNLDGVSPPMKKFLLVEDEPEVLFDLKMGELKLE